MNCLRAALFVMLSVVGSCAATAQEEEVAPVIVNGLTGLAGDVVGDGATKPYTSAASAPALPAWMRPYFAEGASSTLSVAEHTVKHNSFIGSYTAQLTIHDPREGITQRLYLSAWQDSTRGIMQLELVRGMPHTTWFADIEANMAVVANAIGRKAVVSDLKHVLLVDRLREPGAIEHFGPLPMKARMERTRIAGETCTQYELVEDATTMEIWTVDEIASSPFADGPAWIPLNEGPLQAFRFLFKFGEHVVFKFAMAPLLDLEVIAYSPGPGAPPAIDLSGYTLLPASEVGTR